MFFWVKYGFENTPVKMYNANVSSAILLSFVRNTCAREIEDYCKHKHIQLGIELDALRKMLQQTRRGLASADTSSAGALSTTRSTSSSAEALPVAANTNESATTTGSRPPSGASRPTTPGATRSSARAAPAATDEQNEEVAAALAQIDALEKQLAVVDTAAQCARELAAGLLQVDLADKSGAPLYLDQAGAAKASTLVTLREHYTAIAISGADTGERRVTPLVFKLQV